MYVKKAFKNICISLEHTSHYCIFSYFLLSPLALCEMHLHRKLTNKFSMFIKRRRPQILSPEYMIKSKQ
jgi:hypothetical protein